MTTILMICILTLPIQFLIPVPETIRQTIVDISFAIGSITATVALFCPKAVALYFAFHPHAEKNADSHPTVMDVIRSSSKKGGQVAPSSKGRHASMSKLQLLSEAADLFKLPVDDQIAICHEQLELWKVKMMRLNERASGDSGNSSDHGAQGATRENAEISLVAPHGANDGAPLPIKLWPEVSASTKLTSPRFAFQDSFESKPERLKRGIDEVAEFDANAF